MPDHPSSVCPVCGRSCAADYHPFCSKRCADVDLSRWLKGAYRITQDDPDARIEEIDPEHDSSEPGKGEA